MRGPNAPPQDGLSCWVPNIPGLFALPRAGVTPEVPSPPLRPSPRGGKGPGDGWSGAPAAAAAAAARAPPAAAPRAAAGAGAGAGASASRCEEEEEEEEEEAAARGAAAGKRHIYLHATWRTGSSFLGELFNQHPDVFYLYEPMWHLWQALYPGDALSLQGALRDMLRALFRCDFSVLRLYAAPPGPRDPLAPIGLVDGAACEETCPPRALRELEAECRKYPVVVIKDVRLLELGALLPLLREPGLNLRVVQLFRDPRAVHNSRLKARQALLRESIQVLRSRHRAEPRGRSTAWLRDLLLARRAPAWLRRRYTQLRYEDLVREPRAQLRRLLRFAGLPVPPALEAFVLNMTRGAAYSSDRPFLISARDAREAIHAWRERLSRQQVRQVEAACGEAMSLLAYPLSGGGGDAR
uniref:Sulfotransferase n=1 Tax=Accipiter nisus TaxID=211598 RepID=A0A8B9M697_9AVES